MTVLFHEIMYDINYLWIYGCKPLMFWINSINLNLGSISEIITIIIPQGAYYELAPHIITLGFCILSTPMLFLLRETRGQPLDDVFDPADKKVLIPDQRETTKC
jgi:hypothetical protein